MPNASCSRHSKATHQLPSWSPAPLCLSLLCRALLILATLVWAAGRRGGRHDEQQESTSLPSGGTEGEPRDDDDGTTGLQGATDAMDHSGCHETDGEGEEDGSRGRGGAKGKKKGERWGRGGGLGGQALTRGFGRLDVEGGREGQGRWGGGGEQVVCSPTHAVRRHGQCAWM